MNLQHLAIIPDGNRRWGKAHGMKMSADFYLKSGLLGRDLAMRAFDRGVMNMTIWIGSIANLTERPKIEVESLNRAYEKYFNDLSNDQFAVKNHIKIDAFGRWREILGRPAQRAIEKTLATTADFDDAERHLTVLIGYDGDDERGEAVRKLLSDVHLKSPSGDVDSGKVLSQMYYANLLRENSWTGHLPDVDLIIRTGIDGDPHNSASFLSLISSNAQYAFLDTLWPDFTPDMLDSVLNDYAKRERRHGK